MDRKPISLEKETFDTPLEKDYFPSHYDDWININVEEKNEIVPSYDNSDNFWDEYIKTINRITGALAYISNNSDCISDNPGYIQISNDADDFCRLMARKISTNDRETSGLTEKATYYLEQTETIVKYIEHKLNANNAAGTHSYLNSADTQNNTKNYSLLFKKLSPGLSLLILAVSSLSFFLMFLVLSGLEAINSVVSLLSYLLLFLYIILAVFIIPYIILKLIINLLSKLLKNIEK